MIRRIRKTLTAVLVVPALCAAVGTPVLAQEERPAPEPVVIVGNTQFFPLFEAVTLGPGARAHRNLDVSSFKGLSVLAVAESAPNDGRVAVLTIFGPPAVPIPNSLSLSFEGGRSARDGANLRVMGPRLRIEIANRSDQPVEVSLSVYAVK